MFLFIILLFSVGHATICNIKGVWLSTIGNEMEWIADTTSPVTDSGYNFEAVPSVMDTDKFKYRVGKGQASSTGLKMSIDGTDWVGQLNTTGNFDSSCNTITWTDKSIWTRMANIKRVHMVQMSHLDVGYNLFRTNAQGYIPSILNQYFQEHLPRAVDLANAFRAMGYNTNQENTKFLYTQHPWLMDLYLHCPPNFVLSGIQLKCPSAADVAEMRKVIARGDITWHAGPMNLQFEAYNEATLEAGIRIGLRLDKEFGIQRKYRVVSNRDVPAMTRGVIPVFHRMGITAISIGQNPATVAEAEKIFMWKDKESGLSMLTMIHEKMYGGRRRSDCVEVGTIALCMDVRMDNSGPYDSVQVTMQNMEDIAGYYPGATVFASTFDAFLADIEPLQTQLKEYTGEIGDVWIQGIQSDPLHMAVFRELARARSACEKSGQCNVDDNRITGFDRMLIKMPEHTWGSPSVGTHKDWSNAAFQKMRHTGTGEYGFVSSAKAWQENRLFADYAIQALNDHPLRTDIEKRLKFFMDRPLDMSGYKPTTPGDVHSCGAVSLQFDTHGRVIHLQLNGKDWASPTNTLFEVEYAAFNDSDFDYMGKYYGGDAGYNKHGCSNYTRRGRYLPTLTNVWIRPAMSVKMPCSIVAMVKFDPYLHDMIGAPDYVTVNFTIPSSTLDVEVYMHNKTATRLPEQLFLNFRPIIQSGETASFVMDKLTSHIRFEEVILNGNVMNHAVWNGVVMNLMNKGNVSKLIVNSLDVPLVSPITTQPVVFGWLGTPTAFPVPLNPITADEVKGFGFNFFNNVWNTNYPFWYPFFDANWPMLKNVDANQRFRFQMSVA